MGRVPTVSRYRKGQHDLYKPTDHAARQRAFANPPELCKQCSGSGVIADEERPGCIVRCPCGKSPGQHSVCRKLKQQEEQDARMRDVMLGKGW
jgi:hypothetical protein